MITIMEMTTGKWEIDCAATDVRSEMAGCALNRFADDAQPSLRLGLREYTPTLARRVGMPADVAALDVDEFLAAMTDRAR